MLTADNQIVITLDTWIISDTHFFHEKIGSYCSRPENWQELIIKNWNGLVSKDETVLHLGDFALGKKSNFEALIGLLNGRLFLIQGNHDRLKIDNEVVYELGSPEFTFSWNTNGEGTTNHPIRVEVAAKGDNGWLNPSSRNATFTLQARNPLPTPSCTAPFIEDLSFNPGSPATIGTTVNIHAKATWNNCFRSMRVKIDGNVIYELGASEFTYGWNTSDYSAGSHTVRLEVAAQGDNSWSNPASSERMYTLQSGEPPTPIPCTAPPIEDLSFNPSSATVGTTVNIHSKATWNNCFRSMRLKINGNIVYELGSSEFTYSWNTSGYGEGNYSIRLEVAAQGDNSWSNPSIRESNYYLSNSGLPNPSLSSPSNGVLIPPGTNVTLQWNPVSGANEYLVEIWGGKIRREPQYPLWMDKQFRLQNRHHVTWKRAMACKSTKFSWNRKPLE